MTTNKKELIYRQAVIERIVDEDNKDTRALSLSFSSEEPYPRFSSEHGEYLEVLGHKDDEMDTSFIGKGQAPLLLGHDRDVQIGVVRSVEVNDGKGQAEVRFSRSALATEIWNDVVDGIRSNVSVGYYVTEQKAEKEKLNGRSVVRATKWKPVEVSLVSIPADPTVGVGRKDEITEVEATTNNQKDLITMTKEKKETAPDLEAIKREAAKESATSERNRVRAISALGTKYGMSEKADEFINNNKEADLFREYVLENLERNSEKQAPEAREGEAEIGMTKKEVQSYSLMRAIRALANPGDARAQKEAGFELEASRAAESAEKRTARGLIVPYDVLATRALDGTAGDGAELIGTDHLAGSFIDILRSKLVIAQFSPTMMPGLVGNASIPGQLASASVNWFDPAAMSDGAEDELTTRAVPLSPKYVRAVSAISRNTLNQATPSVEQLVRNDLIAQLARAIDQAVFYGTGASNQPEGITEAVTQIVTRFANPVPTFAELVAMKKALALADAEFGNIGYVTDPGTAADLEVLPKDAGSGIFVLENGRAAGYPVVASTQVTAGDVFLGNFNDVVIASWGGLDVTVDTAKYAGSGGLRVIAIQDTDIAFRHVESFAWNNDTA